MRNKRTTRKKRIVSTLLAATVTFSVALAGTYAWRSVSQKALNEAKGNLNPGGRLHDDFNGLNLSSAQTTDAGETARKVKYVYVENFTEEENGDQIYARIRLDEYLETGVGAGKATGDASKAAQPLVAGTTIEDKTGWTTYKWNDAPLFRNYVTLSAGGDTVYLPTFNKDRDSLEADINGTLGGLDKDIETESDDYSDYVKYTYDAANDTNTSKVKSIEIYDADGQETDAVKRAGLTAEKIIEAVRDPQTGRFNVSPTAQTIPIDGLTCTIEKMEPETLNGSSSSSDITAIYLDLDPVATGESPHADIILRAAEHSAKKTLDTADELDTTNTPGIISMETWKKSATAGGMDCQPGNFWVYDSEGWLYWANPIDPETATGCLLNSIAINDTTSEGQKLASTEYYYGLNVVAQFATAGDWGEKADKTGFYKDGLTEDGEMLLDMISNPDDPRNIYEVETAQANPNQIAIQGSTVPFTVRVSNKKTGDTLTESVTDVKWAVERDTTSRTVAETAIDANGNLKISDTEPVGTLTVVVTYNYDAKDATKTVEERFQIEVVSYEMDELTLENGQALPQTGTLEPEESITLKTAVQKTTPSVTSEITTIDWKLAGEKQDSSTSLTDNHDGTATLTIGENETASDLVVTASYQDTNVKDEVIDTKTYNVGDIVTTKYRVTVSGTKTGLVQEDEITYTATVYNDNGTASVKKPQVANPTGITWNVTGADNGTSIDRTSGKLTIGAKQTNTALGITATYKDFTSESYTTNAIIASQYNVVVTVTPETLSPGESADLTVKVTKTNGITSSRILTQKLSDVTWNVGSNSVNTSTGKLTIASGETAASLTVKATYAANNGTEAYGSKTITIEQGTTEQIAVKNTAVGEKVTIGDLQFWKIYEGTEKSTGKKIALMWQVEPEEDYSGKVFSTTDPKWSTSQARSYLSENGTYVSNHLKIEEMINAGIIPRATIYTRGAYNDKTDSNKQTTQDYVFLLSPADLEGRVIVGGDLANSNWSYDTSPADFEYTTYGMTETAIQLFTDLSNKIEILSHKDQDTITLTWLRSPCYNTNRIAGLSFDGNVNAGDAYYFGHGYEGLRPAFWMYI